MIEKQIEQYILEKFEEPGFEDYYLLEVKYNPTNKKAIVFLDSDSGLSLGETSKINRYLQTRIDEAGFLGEKYILDVSSPGVSTPLTLLRQYKKNLGRTLEITHKIEEDKMVKEKGTLTKIEEEGKTITLQYDVKEKVGKKNVVKTIEKQIALASIKKAVVKVSFK